jgi:general L-amino acid transport system substrate-binding protein
MGFLALLLFVWIFVRPPDTEFVEITRQVQVMQPVQVVEVTRVVAETITLESEPVEVTRIVVETIVEDGPPIEVTRVVVETIVEEVALAEVTRVVVETVVVEVTRVVAEQTGNIEQIPVTFAGGGDTLTAVRERGVLNCGISGIFPGFSFIAEDGSIRGFDWDFCRAVAAAVLGDANDVNGRATTATERFPVLQSGEVDLLVRTTTRTITRDSALGFDFAPATFYDGQGFMVRVDSGITGLPDLNGADICVTAGTTTELNLAAEFQRLGFNYEPILFNDFTSGMEMYESGGCDAFTTDKTGLISIQFLLTDPSSHTILPDTISKEPIGPVVRHGDNNWADIVTWTVYCTIQAEESGITMANVDDMLGSSDSLINNLLGVNSDLGSSLGLSNDFCYQVIKQVGNYGEIYGRNLGPNTLFNLPRGLNSLWRDGGLLYAPPFR